MNHYLYALHTIDENFSAEEVEALIVALRKTVLPDKREKEMWEDIGKS
jgi:hypothetical protein